MILCHEFRAASEVN